ncbi:UNVERIFIED_CONTAM: hypothetical protein FKN15_000073 [Acipenser sinensis]
MLPLPRGRGRPACPGAKEEERSFLEASVGPGASSSTASSVPHATPLPPPAPECPVPPMPAAPECPAPPMPAAPEGYPTPLAATRKEGIWNDYLRILEASQWCPNCGHFIVNCPLQEEKEEEWLMYHIMWAERITPLLLCPMPPPAPKSREPERPAPKRGEPERPPPKRGEPECLAPKKGEPERPAPPLLECPAPPLALPQPECPAPPPASPAPECPAPPPPASPLAECPEPKKGELECPVPKRGSPIIQCLHCFSAHATTSTRGRSSVTSTQMPSVATRMPSATSAGVPSSIASASTGVSSTQEEEAQASSVQEGGT